MSRVTVSVRLTRAQMAVIRRHAEAHGISTYQTAIRIMEAGLGAMIGGVAEAKPDDAISFAVGELQARAERLERFADRALYTASAAYAYARQAALVGSQEPKALDEAVAQAAGEAYRRQLDLARGER